MTHEFDQAFVRRTDDGSWLCLRIKNAPMARQECSKLKSGKAYSAEIKEKRNRRSNRANAYFWELCGKVAAYSNIPKTALYRSYVKEIGGNYRIVPVANEQQRELIARLWEAQGIGWIAEDAGNGWLCCYYGSSTYDSVQMARLVEMVVCDCKDAGIETEPPGSIAAMLSSWKPDERTV